MNKTGAWIAGIVIVAGGLIWWGSAGMHTAAPATIADPNNLPGMQTSTTTWVAEIPHLAERLKAIGLPTLSEEGTTLHIHQHLDLFINGQQVTVPAGIGINQQAFISQIHTHDTSGVIHVESPTIQTFTLGQFFDIWGVRFTAECIGGYCNNDAGTMNIFLNGEATTTDPRSIVLTPHEEIVITYGSSSSLPVNLPKSYDFPQGE